VAREGAVEAGGSGARLLAEAKVRAELSAADALYPGADAITGSGAITPTVVIVKGEPGEADLAAGVALAGAGREHTAKDVPSTPSASSALRTASPSAPGVSGEAAADRLRLIIEALDPSLVIALDRVAASDTSSAFSSPELVFGSPLRVGGRVLLAVDDLEGSLTDGRKAEVWQQFRGLRGAAAGG